MLINWWWWPFCCRWRPSSFLSEVMNSTYFKRFLSHINFTACRQLLIILPAHIDQCLLWTTEWIQSKKKTKTDQLKRNGRNCKNVDILLFWCSTLFSPPAPYHLLLIHVTNELSYLIQHKCSQYQVISTKSTNNWRRYLTFSLRHSDENSRRLRHDAVIGKVTSETSVTFCQWTGRNISADKSSRNWQLGILHTNIGRRHTLFYVQPVVSRGTTNKRSSMFE